jgi:hypothetical protein
MEGCAPQKWSIKFQYKDDIDMLVILACTAVCITVITKAVISYLYVYSRTINTACDIKRSK